MKEIRLTNSDKVALVDDEDFPWLEENNWQLGTNGGAERCQCLWGKRYTVHMSRVIMNCPKDMEVDHVNRNRLDNQKSNLRVATRPENCRNTGKFKRKCSSKYKGVSWTPKTGRWRAYISRFKKRTNLGYFSSEVEAAEAYNAAAIRLFGKFAGLNAV